MAKREHPADAWTRKQIETAVGFDIHFMKGPLERYREHAESIEDARVIAARLDAEHGQYGRRSIIYAILPNKTRLPVGTPYRRSTPSPAP